MNINVLKRYWLLLFLCSISFSLYGQNELSLLADSLGKLIDHEQSFIDQKEERIKKLKLKLKDAGILEEYKLNLKLHDEYKKFCVDSAIHYIKRNIDIAVALGEKEQEIDANLKLALLYSMGGMYREAELILTEIDPSGLSRELLSIYYDVYRRFWEYYSISTTRTDLYKHQVEKYLNLFLDNADPNSTNYKVCYIMNRIAPHNLEEAEKQLLELLAIEEKGSPDYAIITCELAIINRNKKQPNQERKYFMQSAIADIINVTRENFSLQNLAIISYADNDLDRAFKYTQTAVDEAIASGIQFRATQINEFYPVISAAYQVQEAKVKSNLIVFLILLGIFSVLVVTLTVYTYRQIKKIKQIKEALSDSNTKLQNLNKALNDANNQLYSKNTQLQDINNVKEQFIAQFFDLCSNYITRMEEHQNSLYKLAVNRRYEVLLKQLKSTANIDEELEALYSHFDNIFLNLYPTFITDFNALLRDGEQIIPKTGSLLNKELRIYALLRLGINDGAKIASFLRCSTSTVYNYRTKMRNKSIINKDDFENEVLQIGAGK